MADRQTDKIIDRRADKLIERQTDKLTAIWTLRAANRFGDNVWELESHPFISGFDPDTLAYPTGQAKLRCLPR